MHNPSATSARPAQGADSTAIDVATSSLHRFLAFKLDKEVFAIDILHIKEIIEYGQVTTLPMLPDFIRGVINLRGAVVPVVDLAGRFGDTATEITRKSCIIIIESPAQALIQVIGLLVDAVTEVLEISASAIEPAPSFGTGVHNHFITGMGKVDGRFVMLLNVNKVLSGKEMVLIGENGASTSKQAAIQTLSTDSSSPTQPAKGD